METLDLIKPVELTADQKAELHDLMVQANSILKPLAQKMFGERGLRKLRNEVRAGRVELSASEAVCIQRVVANEGLILAGYIRVATQLVKAFYLRTKQDMDDLWQEAAMGIYDAIYSFDGRNEFSTYVYYSVKNRLIKVRKNPECSLDSEDFPELADKSAEPKRTILDVYDVRTVLAKCSLSVQEREVIDYYLQDAEDGWQCRWAGKIHLTKQRVHQIYKSAKAKIARCAVAA